MTTPFGPLSLNEILFFITRATVGAGAPFGIGEDVGKAAVLLANRGIDSAVVIAPALQSLEAGNSSMDIELRTDGDGSVIEAIGNKPMSAAIAASAASDWIQENAGNAKARLMVHRVDAPVLFAAVIEALHQGHVGWRVCISAPDGTETALIKEQNLLENDAPSNITIAADPSAQPVFKNRQQQALDCGVPVDSQAWQIIRDLFSRCLVPSTEETRLTGAGAGLTDTD